MRLVKALYFFDKYENDMENLIEQFVVTNCIRERSGSIVNESLKNGILILINTSKELDFHADFKYISFIKFSLTHQKIRA